MKKEKILPVDLCHLEEKAIAIVDAFGILSDDNIRKYFKLGCEVKALGRGHIQRIKKEVKNFGKYFWNSISIIGLPRKFQT